LEGSEEGVVSMGAGAVGLFKKGKGNCGKESFNYWRGKKRGSQCHSGEV